MSREHAVWRRQELDLGGVAGISDRGRLRAENEDALWVGAADGWRAAVVCDGISAAWRAGEAAGLAAAAVGSRLQDELDAAGSLEPVLLGAVQAAQVAVGGLHPGVSIDAPACTLVAAAVRDGRLVVAGIGDSRAYWLGARCRQLTTDDAWGNAVTNWIGRDAPDVAPVVASFDATPGGRVVLCSDGLSKYLSEPRRVRDVGAGLAPLGASEALVDHALAAGGRDNVTVAVIDVPRAGGLLP